MWSPLFYSNEPTSLAHENFLHIYFHRIIVSDISAYIATERLYRRRVNSRVSLYYYRSMQISLYFVLFLFFFFFFFIFFFLKDASEFHSLTRVKSGTIRKYVRNFFSKFCQEATGKKRPLPTGHSSLYTRAEYTHTHTHTRWLELNRGTDTSWPSIQFDSPLDRRYQFRDTGNGDTVRVGRIDGRERRSGMGWNGGRGAGEQYRIDLFFFLNEVFFNGVNFITLSIY